MIDFLTSIATNGYTNLYNILLGLIALGTAVLLVGTVINHRKKYNAFQYQKDVMTIENKDGKWIWQ